VGEFTLCDGKNIPAAFVEDGFFDAFCCVVESFNF
jgi:hypothetical protein